MHVVTATELTGVEYYLNKLANLLGGLALECKLYQVGAYAVQLITIYTKHLRNVSIIKTSALCRKYFCSWAIVV